MPFANECDLRSHSDLSGQNNSNLFGISGANVQSLLQQHSSGGQTSGDQTDQDVHLIDEEDKDEVILN